MLKHTETETNPNSPVIVPTSVPQEAAAQTDSTASNALQDAILQTFLQSKVQRQWRQTLRSTGGILASAAGIALLSYIGFQRHLDSLLPFVLCLFPAFVLARIALGASRRTQQTETDIAEMVQAGGIRAVGPLLEMLTVTANQDNLITLYRVLTSLLPRLKVSDSYLLNADQRGILNGQLLVISEWLDIPHYREEFVLALLHALEQVGDPSSLSVVEQLTRMVTPTFSRKRIRQAALECLPALRQNVGHVQQNQTLLRASDRPAADPALLLRPAAPAVPTSPDQLLRSAPPENTDTAF